MSIEHYAIFRAPEHSPAYVFAHDIMRERQAAHEVRCAFASEIKAEGLWASDAQVTGAVFIAPLPPGWRKSHDIETGVIAKPDCKTKIGKELKAKLAALPVMPDSWAYTKRIGGPTLIIGRVMRYCFFEQIGDAVFVMSPLPDAENKVKLFEPSGCERVPLSVYFAAKEAQEAKAKKGGRS